MLVCLKVLVSIVVLQSVPVYVDGVKLRHHTVPVVGLADFIRETVHLPFHLVWALISPKVQERFII